MSDEIKPRPLAVALQYEKGTRDAPRVVAKGRGVLADRIVELVRRRGDTETTLADVVGSLQVPHETAEAAMGVLAGRQPAEHQAVAGEAGQDVLDGPRVGVVRAADVAGIV